MGSRTIETAGLNPTEMMRREPAVISPYREFVMFRDNALAAVGRGELYLPTETYMVDALERQARVIVPPISQAADGSQLYWIGYHERGKVTGAAGRISCAKDYESSTSVLEISVMESGRAEGETRLTIKNQSIFFSGAPISEPADLHLIAGEPDLSDFDLITTLQSLTNAPTSWDILLVSMVQNILDKTNRLRLEQVSIDPDLPDGENIIKLPFPNYSLLEEDELAS